MFRPCTARLSVVATLATWTCLPGASAFVLPSRMPAGAPGNSVGTASTLPSYALTVQRVPEALAGSRHSTAALTPLSLGVLLFGAAALRRKESRDSSATARRVTLKEISQLKPQDVPSWFRPKISVGMARRNSVSETIGRKLDETFFIMAFNKDVMPTSELEAARAMFPDTITVRCLKNSLVKRAMLGTPWEPFGTALKGSNMFVFVKNDSDLKGAIEAYVKIEKKFQRNQRLATLYEKYARKYTFKLMPCRGGMLRDEWNVISPEDLPKLKDFPTKLELIAKVAGSIKQVTQKIAVSVNQVPRKLAIGTKKIVEKMEEGGKAKVGDVVA